jgi:hypothetical protein
MFFYKILLSGIPALMFFYKIILSGTPALILFCKIILSGTPALMLFYKIILSGTPALMYIYKTILSDNCEKANFYLEAHFSCIYGRPDVWIGVAPLDDGLIGCVGGGEIPYGGTAINA